MQGGVLHWIRSGGHHYSTIAMETYSNILRFQVSRLSKYFLKQYHFSEFLFLLGMYLQVSHILRGHGQSVVYQKILRDFPTLGNRSSPQGTFVYIKKKSTGEMSKKTWPLRAYAAPPRQQKHPCAKGKHPSLGEVPRYGELGELSRAVSQPHPHHWLRTGHPHRPYSFIWQSCPKFLTNQIPEGADLWVNLYFNTMYLSPSVLL